MEGRKVLTVGRRAFRSTFSVRSARKVHFRSRNGLDANTLPHGLAELCSSLIELVQREDQCPVAQVVPVEMAAQAPEDLA
jgi:hypothetical protein